MYIYEGHMGGLYTTKTELSYDELYCDQCGDSDWLLGQANTIEEAWELLKDQTATFDNTICETCIHQDDFEYCDFECMEYQKSGGWDCGYVMKFLYENFKHPKQETYFILLSKHVNCNDMILVNCQPPQYKMGDAYELLKIPTLDETLIAPLNSLIMFTDEYVEGSLKKLKTITIKNKKYIIYTCNTDEEGEEWKDSAHYGENGWYGYVKLDEIKDKLLDDKELIKQITKIIEGE